MTELVFESTSPELIALVVNIRAIAALVWFYTYRNNRNIGCIKAWLKVKLTFLEQIKMALCTCKKQKTYTFFFIVASFSLMVKYSIGSIKVVYQF